MINLNKSLDFFNPRTVDSRCHIIGCGSVGGNIAIGLARLGITKITLYDFDIVESKNIANQCFRNKDIGQLKVDALENILMEINPEIEVRKKPEGWNDDRLNGHVFMAVDSIEVRQKITEKCVVGGNVQTILDFRTGLTDAQHFAATFNDMDSVKSLRATMEFSHEEAAEATPASACGETLGVASIPRMISDYGVNNFVNYMNGKPLAKMIIIDGFAFTTVSV